MASLTTCSSCGQKFSGGFGATKCPACQRQGRLEQHAAASSQQLKNIARQNDVAIQQQQVALEQQQISIGLQARHAALTEMQLAEQIRKTQQEEAQRARYEASSQLLQNHMLTLRSLSRAIASDRADLHRVWLNVERIKHETDGLTHENVDPAQRRDLIELRDALNQMNEKFAERMNGDESLMHRWIRVAGEHVALTEVLQRTGAELTAYRGQWQVDRSPPQSLEECASQSSEIESEAASLRQENQFEPFSIAIRIAADVLAGPPPSARPLSSGGGIPGQFARFVAAGASRLNSSGDANAEIRMDRAWLNAVADVGRASASKIVADSRTSALALAVACNNSFALGVGYCGFALASIGVVNALTPSRLMPLTVLGLGIGMLALSAAVLFSRYRFVRLSRDVERWVRGVERKCSLLQNEGQILARHHEAMLAAARWELDQDRGGLIRMMTSRFPGLRDEVYALARDRS